MLSRSLVCLLYVTSCISVENAFERDKLLVFVPGMSLSSETVVDLLTNNLRIINETAGNALEILCLISSYSHKLPGNATDLQNRFSGCDITFYPDALYADHVKSLLPVMLKYASIDYVFLLLDDVELAGNGFNISRLVRITQLNNLTVSSPAVIGAALPSTKYKPQFFTQLPNQELFSVGYATEAIEIFSTLFTYRGWQCFHEFVNPYFNSKGYLYDRYLWFYCNSQSRGSYDFGVVQNMTVIHSAWKLSGRKTPGSVTFHDKIFWDNINADGKCGEVTVACNQSISRHHQAKHDYHWSWAIFEGQNVGKTMILARMKHAIRPLIE